MRRLAAARRSPHTHKFALSSLDPTVQHLEALGLQYGWRAVVALVGSHADTARRQNPGPALVANTERLRAEVVRRFGHVFSVEDIILMMDSGAAGSQEIKTFKNLLQQRKQQIIEVCVSITREINCWLRE